MAVKKIKESVEQNKTQPKTKRSATAMTALDFPKRLYSRTETAKILGISSSAILAMWALRKTPKLPYVRIGKMIRYLEEDILDFISKNRIAE